MEVHIQPFNTNPSCTFHPPQDPQFFVVAQALTKADMQKHHLKQNGEITTFESPYHK